MNNSLTSSRMW
nr:unnamed protein product [Callosobruchus chinensis]CAH7759973.1 unnamed protein product [Callosobruchus chinensis]CAH7767385.1 unnamed protein product [Callosobruchus chinensis]